MGDQADDILTSFGLSEDDRKTYTTVKDKFENHFVKKRNVIFERAKFNQKKQEEGEPVDTFITSLCGLAEYCEYGALHDDMIRDRIVVGLRDAQLSEKLQLDAGLTLEKAITKACQSEAVKQQQAVVRASGEVPHNVDALYGRQAEGNASGKDPPKPGTGSPKCTRCGRMHTMHQPCPARNAICHKCHK